MRTAEVGAEAGEAQSCQWQCVCQPATRRLCCNTFHVHHILQLHDASH